MSDDPAPNAPPGRRRWILVTGMPRSGTTGVGGALSQAPRAAHLYEPLNAESGLRSVDEYFVIPPPGGPGAGDELQRQLAQVFGVSLRMRRGIWPQDSLGTKVVKTFTGSTTRVSAARIRLDPRIRTVIWKDPFAAFLVPYVSAALGIGCVVTVRPPEAAAASFKRLGWSFDLDRIHARLSLLTPGAAYLEKEPEWSAWLHRPPIVGALLWRLVYGYLDAALPPPDQPRPATTGPVLWANSRLLLADPMTAYASWFDALELELTPAARDAIERAYRDEGSTEPSARTHDRNRNVMQANAYWRRVLDADEEHAVRRITAAVRADLERRVGALA